MGHALDLDLFIPDRPTVRIRTKDNRDGTVYEFRVKGELSPVQLQKVYRIGEKGQELAKKFATEGSIADMEEADVRLLELKMDELLDIAIADDRYAEFKDQLNLEHKLAIMQTFSSACLNAPTKQATEATSTGVS